ncbi:MAG: carboxylating nicotinate-nucleotide diphosphorylase [Bacteroidota bacterium]
MAILPDYLSNAYVNQVIDSALREDVGSGDVTTLATVPRGRKIHGRFDVREEGVVSGLWIAEQIFRAVDSSLVVRWAVDDGASVRPGDVIGDINGDACGALTGERTALNIIQRMSGISTMTRKMVDIAEPFGVRILDTRKTAPGLRPLDKWAVALGGGENHRIGLFDMILIKDNHIAAAGGIVPAVKAANEHRHLDGRRLKIELEVRTLEDVRTALSVGHVDVLLLDNMAKMRENGTIDVSMLEEAVQIAAKRIPTEASGNVTLDTVEAIARTGVDYISCGALTHSVRALDVSLNLQLAS